MNLIFEYVATNTTEIVLVLSAVLIVCCWYLFVYKPPAQKMNRIEEDLKKSLVEIAELRSQIYTIAENTQVLRNDNVSILTSLEELENRLENASRLITNISSRVKEVGTARQPSPEAQIPKRRYTEVLCPTIDQFCNLYNAVVTREASQSELFERYNKPFRIAVPNTTDRRRNSSDRPVFEERPNGDFWAFHIDGEDSYVVVPRIGLTLQHSIYSTGAFNIVFECPDFDSALNYRHMTVVRPASFARDATTPNEWILKEKGKLELGTGS